MSLLNFDAEMINTKVDMDKILFLKRHLDAFLTFYEEQGKCFWFRYIISFRDVMYKHHFSDLKSSMPICKHQVSHICDEAFITLHREFIECTKSKKAKSALWDMMIVVIYYIQYPTFPGNNPFQHSETKSSFIRFFGITKYSTFQRKLMDALLAPVFLCFTSSLHTLLIRWLKEKKETNNNTLAFKWVHPPEWTTSKFIPSKFEMYIACYYGNTLEKELDVDAKIRVMVFQNRPEKPRALYDDKKQSLLLNCDCKERKSESKISFKKYIADEIQNICTHKKEDFKDLDYFEVLDPAIEDSIDSSCPICTEEAKKKILFKLAEDKFRQEEMLDEMSTHPKTTTHKKKGKNKPKSGLPRKLSNSSNNSESISEGAVGGYASSKPFVANQVIQKCKEKGFTEDNLKLIKDNIDKIEQSIKEKGSLDTEHLSLMLETGAILKSPEKIPTKLKNSSIKDTTESKKNSKAKPKKKKAQIQPILASTETNSKTESPITLRSCSNCQKEGKLKKCALCVKENVCNIRYYCSRECQADDWVKCHKTEHDKGTA